MISPAFVQPVMIDWYLIGQIVFLLIFFDCGLEWNLHCNFKTSSYTDPPPPPTTAITCFVPQEFEIAHAALEGI